MFSKSKSNIGKFDFVDSVRGHLDNVIISKSHFLRESSDYDIDDNENVNNNITMNPTEREVCRRDTIIDVSPLPEQEKTHLVLIERDYNVEYGSAIQFTVECPRLLLNSTNINEDQFECTIAEINRRLLMEQYMSLCRRFMIILNVCSCYIPSLLFGHEKVRYKKWKANVTSFIESENGTKYNDLGIHIDSPFDHGLRFIHVYYVKVENCCC